VYRNTDYSDTAVSTPIATASKITMNNRSPLVGWRRERWINGEGGAGPIKILSMIRKTAAIPAKARPT
jgi:hypothetical protein